MLLLKVIRFLQQHVCDERAIAAELEVVLCAASQEQSCTVHVAATATLLLAFTQLKERTIQYEKPVQGSLPVHRRKIESSSTLCIWREQSLPYCNPRCAWLLWSTWGITHVTQFCLVTV